MINCRHPIYTLKKTTSRCSVLRYALALSFSTMIWDYSQSLVTFSMQGITESLCFLFKFSDLSMLVESSSTINEAAAI